MVNSSQWVNIFLAYHIFIILLGLSCYTRFDTIHSTEKSNIDSPFDNYEYKHWSGQGQYSQVVKHWCFCSPLDIELDREFA